MVLSVMDSNLILQVKILTPKQTVFEGQALSVSSTNSVGKFDILPKHANFITLIENQPIEIQDMNREFKKFQFSQAIIYNISNKVSIFAEPLGEIKPQTPQPPKQQ